MPVNAVHLDTDGNLLISSRFTWTIYKVNLRTGAIMWQLGGKHSTFAVKAAPGQKLDNTGETQPEGLTAGATGSAQTTKNGDLFVSWGGLSYFSEFSPSGKLLFNAKLPDGTGTYRAYRLRWNPDS